MIPPTPSAPRRRYADSTLDRLFAHWKLLIAFACGAVTVIAGVGAWLGAQSASPGQRISRLESKVDNGLIHLNLRMDTLDLRQDSLAVTHEKIDDKLDLLLRLQCRAIGYADLIRQCDRAGASRR